MYVQQAAGFWFRMPGGYALHRVPGGVADAPQTSPLVRLAAAGPAATADDLAAGRAQLAQQHYRAIVVLTRLPDAGSATSLATALTGRPANRVLGGVAVWTLPG